MNRLRPGTVTQTVTPQIAQSDADRKILSQHCICGFGYKDLPTMGGDQQARQTMQRQTAVTGMAAVELALICEAKVRNVYRHANHYGWKVFWIPRTKRRG